MPIISSSGAFARDRERLAGRAACPDGPVVGPLGEPERARPSSEPGKEVALCEPSKVVGSNISY